MRVAVRRITKIAIPPGVEIPKRSVYRVDPRGIKRGFPMVLVLIALHAGVHVRLRLMIVVPPRYVWEMSIIVSVCLIQMVQLQ